MATTENILQDLHQWKEELPPILGTVRASSLIPIFRRQQTVLKIAYAHAVMHVTRPFLLNNFSNLAKRPESNHAKLDGLVQECIDAANTVLHTVQSFVDDGLMFQAFWFTQYISFCAIMVSYIYVIQQYHVQHSATTESDLLERAERCQKHVQNSSRPNSAGERYAIILEELRLEVYRQTGRNIPPNEPVTAGQIHPGSTCDLASSQTLTAGSDAALLGPLLDSADSNEDYSDAFEGWRGNLGWTELDSWVRTPTMERDILILIFCDVQVYSNPADESFLFFSQ